MYNHNKFTLFQVLIGKFDQKLNFHPQLAEVGFIRTLLGPTRKKHGFQGSGIVLHRLHEQVTLINLIS